MKKELQRKMACYFASADFFGAFDHNRHHTFRKSCHLWKNSGELPTL